MVLTTLDAVGIGNAIVDVITNAEDKFLEDMGLAKGAMTLIDAVTAETLYKVLVKATLCSGGAAANTMAGLASLGGKGAFIGKVRDDKLGSVFRNGMHTTNLRYDTEPADHGAPTARCMIFVTPDAKRTMQTFLGASRDLGPDDIDPDTIAAAKVTYLEGYLWDPPEAKKAYRKAARIAHEAGKKVALNLSDPFCVARHRDDFMDLVMNHVDILFASELEIISLYQAAGFDEALQQVRGHCQVAALTRSEKGSVVLSGDETHDIDAEPVAKVVDTTGAGDLYAAGFLFGLTHGLDHATSGRLGALAAAEVINHFGARPETSLAELAAAKGLLPGG